MGAKRLHQDFLRAKRVYEKARQDRKPRVYISMFKAMQKIHKALCEMGE